MTFHSLLALLALLARLAWLALLLVSACAHAPLNSSPEGDPRARLEKVCALGLENRSVRGSLQLKTRSPDVSGQFSANVQVASPQALVLEVTNLLGGSEAIVRVHDERYEIEGTGKKYAEKGVDSWGGIPLRWGPQLFLGQIPCAEASLRKDAAVSWRPAGTLVVEVPANLASDPSRYTYELGTDARPRSVRWERWGPVPRTVDFHFDGDAKWEAKSAQGEVKVHWKDRHLN